MTGGVTSATYALVLVTAFASAPQLAAPSGAPRRRPTATVAALLAVGLPTVAQLTVAPWLLGHLRRDWAQIGGGQVWRLVTALVVQDGGLPGAAFNLVSLAVLGVAAEAAWGRRRWVVLALGAGVGAQFWGRVVQPVGAGNSVAVFGLAASLAVLGVRRGTAAQRALGAVSLLASVVLLVTGDLHGGAVAIGAAISAAWLWSPRAPGAPLGQRRASPG